MSLKREEVIDDWLKLLCTRSSERHTQIIVGIYINLITGPFNGPVLFCWLASVVVVCNAAGGRAGRARGRSGGHYCTAGQSYYVSLGRHLDYFELPFWVSMQCRSQSGTWARLTNARIISSKAVCVVAYFRWTDDDNGTAVWAVCCGQVYSVLVIRKQIPRYVRLHDSAAASRYECALSLSVFYQPVSMLCGGRRTVTYSGPVIDVLTRTDRVDPLTEQTLDVDWRSARYDIDAELTATDACITFADGGKWLYWLLHPSHGGRAANGSLTVTHRSLQSDPWVDPSSHSCSAPAAVLIILSISKFL